MTDTDVLKVSLDNLQSLLKKIDENQIRLFDTQNLHSKEVERLNGLIEKNTSTTRLELMAINKDIQNNLEKDGVLAEEVKNLKIAKMAKLEKKLEDLRCLLKTETDKLAEQITENTTFRKNLEGLVDKVDKNTEFRQNMAGFSWIRHGIPLLMLLIAIATLIYTFAQ